MEAPSNMHRPGIPKLGSGLSSKKTCKSRTILCFSGLFWLPWGKLLFLFHKLIRTAAKSVPDSRSAHACISSASLFPVAREINSKVLPFIYCSRGNLLFAEVKLLFSVRWTLYPRNSAVEIVALISRVEKSTFTSARLSEYIALFRNGVASIILNVDGRWCFGCFRRSCLCDMKKRLGRKW